MTARALLFTDVVDSTGIVQRLGDAGAAALWAEHDRLARGLLARHGGREIDRSDGFFLLFDDVAPAVAYAQGYHAALATLGIAARVGLHRGDVTLRTNTADAVALGAKPIEVDGLAKPLAARVMSLARGGQTLATEAAAAALQPPPPGCEVHALGHYRAKGLAEPVAIVEIAAPGRAGVPPHDTEKVYRVVRDGDLWRPLRDVPHNLAPERDAFVGRGAELARLARLFDGGARLLTLLGVGGTGKTRLARRYARAWLGEWPGGVTFCDLSEARTPEGIQFAVALAMGVPLAKGDAVAQLAHVIAARGRCLVILDNAEQVVEPVAAVTAAWLDRAPEAAFVVTSRERLHLPGETVVAVDPLALDSDAIELFVARARAQQPGFDADADPARRAAIGEIVRLLDGLPLAVELAAARVRVLSPAQIVQRLRDRFVLLTGARGAAARQATLKAAIDWSWALLQPWEQAALAQCAVFEGGFHLEAAEAVVDLAGLPGAPPVLDVVQSLVDKSLLRAWVPDAAARLSIAEPLFGMYLTIHEYAAAQLARAGDAVRQAAEARHGRHYAAHGSDEALDRLLAAGGMQRRQGLLLELDNLSAACRRAVARGDAAVAVPAFRAAWEALLLRGPFAAGAAMGEAVLALPGLPRGAWLDTASSLADALFRCGRLADAARLLDDACAAARADADERRLGQLLLQVALARRERGELPAARVLFEEALALHRRLGLGGGEAVALHGLGNVLDQLGEPVASREHHAAALALHRARGHRHGEGHVHASLGILDRHQGRYADSVAQYEQALAIFRETGDRRSEAIALGNLGNTYEDLGREDDCRRCLEQALQMHRQLGSRIVEAFVLANLGLAHQRRGELDRAHELLEQALAIDREVANRIHEGVVLSNLGAVDALQQRHAQARERFEAAMALHRAAGNRLYIGMTSALLAQTLLAAGEPQAAIAPLDEGEALLRAIDNPTELGMLLATRARICHALGDAAAARRAVAECEALAAPMGEGSRLDVEAAAVRRLVDGGA